MMMMSINHHVVIIFNECKYHRNCIVTLSFCFIISSGIVISGSSRTSCSSSLSTKSALCALPITAWFCIVVGCYRYFEEPSVLYNSGQEVLPRRPIPC